MEVGAKGGYLLRVACLRGMEGGPQMCRVALVTRVECGRVHFMVSSAVGTPAPGRVWAVPLRARAHLMGRLADIQVLTEIGGGAVPKARRRVAASLPRVGCVGCDD